MLGMIGRRLQITRCDVCFKHAGKVKRFSGCVTKSVSGGTHGSFFKRSLLLDTVVAKATQRHTTTGCLTESYFVYNISQTQKKTYKVLLHGLRSCRLSASKHKVCNILTSWYAT